jgi:tetratricopeptide (TPR) repeat protein
MQVFQRLHKWVSPLSLALILMVSVGCSRDRETAKREYLASGDEFTSQGKVREAIVQYRNAVRQDPRFGEARYKLAEAYVRNDEIGAAAREYIRAADLLPKDEAAQLKAGRFLLMSRRFEDAKTRALNALALNPKNPEAQVLLGNALAGLKDLDGAVGELKEAIKLDPANTLGYVSLGSIEKAAGRTGEAEAAFKKAIETDPTSITAQLSLANFYWATRRAPEALDALHLAFKLEPNHPLVNQMLALFLVTMGKPAEAEPYFRKLVEVTHDDRAKLTLADYYVASGRSQDALPLLQQLLSSKQSRTAAELRYAELDFRENRKDEGRRRLDDLLKREPGNAAALVLKGQMLLSDGKIDDAVASLQAAVSADTSSAEAHFALGRAYLAKNDHGRAVEAFNETSRLNPRAVGAQLELSRLELAAGRVDNSIQFAEQAMKNAGDASDARLALVRGLIARRDIARADAEVRRLMTQFPESSAVRTQAGIIAAIKGDQAAAAKLLTGALSADENNLEALTALITLDLRQKNPGRAVSRVEGRLARHADEPASLLLAARTYAAAGDVKKAEELLRKTIDADPSNFQAYGTLGRLYVTQNRLDEALKEFETLAKRQPRPVQAHTMVGSLLEAQNKPQEASKHYEQALAIDPEMPVAANNLAWIYTETGGNLDVALELAQRAARRMPDHPAVQDTLGWIYYKKGLASLAVPAFLKSVEGDPRNPAFQFHLGLAYAKAGEASKARLALQRAMALEPNFDGAVEAKQVLASLPGDRPSH